jgi:hypothetical protein
VSVQSQQDQLETRTKFSWAIMDMLKTDPVTKILFLQDYLVEKRYKLVLKVRYYIIVFKFQWSSDSYITRIVLSLIGSRR